MPTIPLPSFLGYNLGGVGTTRLDKFFNIYTNLSTP